MTRIEKFSHGVPSNVKLETIEEELSHLWESAAEEVEEESQSPITRAASLNLVIYSEDKDGGATFAPVLSALTEEVPCRVILFLAEPDAPEATVDSWVSANCHIPQAGAKQVCSEQITILARGTAAETSSNVVQTFLIPDLPVVLWWDASLPTHSNFFSQLAPSVDHVVYDSAIILSMQDARGLRDFLSAWNDQVSLGDLNWVRLSPWQSLLAQFFDVEQCRAMLSTIDSITLKYEAKNGSGESGFLQALLLVGWMAGRLHWKELTRPEQDTPSSWRWKLVRGKDEIEIRLHATSVQDNRADEIMEVSLHSSMPAGEASIVRLGEGSEVQTLLSVQGMKPLHRMLSLRRSAGAELLGNELESLAPHPLYNEALKFVGG